MYAHKSSWSGLHRHGDDYQQIMVRCDRLDTLLERAGIDEIDLLSIDVEGTELDVWDSFEPTRHRPSIAIQRQAHVGNGSRAVAPSRATPPGEHACPCHRVVDMDTVE